MTDKERVAEALRLVTGVVGWARSTYYWEDFWHDMRWTPEGQADRNGKKLRDWIASFEEVFPELKG
jgi:hypothetical protein